MPPLFVCDTSIRIHNGLYSLNDLHKAAGSEAKHKPSNFMRVEQTQGLIAEIQFSDMRSATETVNGGKDRGTYVCRELVYAYAMWISPKFSLAVIRAFDKFSTSNPPPPANPQPLLIDDSEQWYLAKMQGGTITHMVLADEPCTVKFLTQQFPELEVVSKDVMRDNLQLVMKQLSDLAGQFTTYPDTSKRFATGTDAYFARQGAAA